MRSLGLITLLVAISISSFGLSQPRPDLVIWDIYELKVVPNDTTESATSACAVTVNGQTVRRTLRFGVKIANIGDQDFVSPGTPENPLAFGRFRLLRK